MTTLRAVVARLAWLVRCAGLAYIVVQVAIWHSFYAEDPWRLFGPAAAAGWAAAVLFYLRQRWPGPRFACLDSAVYLALGLAAQGCVPPEIHGDAFSWLAIAMSSQVVVPAWFASSELCLPLTLTSPLAYWIGADQIAGIGGRMVTVAAILLFTLAGAHLYARRALYRRAAAADAALDQADRDVSEQYAVLSRNVERREHERLLHDTILNTLTALARAEGAAEVMTRCRQDVALIESALTGQADQDPGAERLYGDLAEGVQAIAAEMRARGLTVHVHVDVADGGGGDGDGDDGAAAIPVAIPAPVATAIANAAREALSNVAAHAGTGEAWVEVSLTQPGRLQVTVRDRGAGFDPASVDQTRLGLRRSIAERTADCGGQASIWSAPQQGTVVRLSWPAQAQPGQTTPDQTALAGSPPW
jgi:signal transduction histidine kinase